MGSSAEGDSSPKRDASSCQIVTAMLRLTAKSRNSPSSLRSSVTYPMRKSRSADRTLRMRTAVPLTSTSPAVTLLSPITDRSSSDRPAPTSP